MPRVRPEILLWARECAGLTADQAVEKLGLKSARGKSAVMRLAEFEAGEDVPRGVLAKMAKQYRRPLITFYLSAPPLKGDRGQDFRTLPQDRPQTADALLDALIRDVRARQSIVRAILEDDDDVERRHFVGSMQISDGVARLVASIHETIGLDLAEIRAQRSTAEAFSLLRSHVESVGIFVLLIGNLGSHHTTIDLTTFRGFAIADPIAPFVVVNDQDVRPAWSFTLVHELAHLWIGATGISGALAENRIERFCNDVAGEFLLPAAELAGFHVADEIQVTAARIREFANERHLSRSMVAYKLFRIRSISQATWSALSIGFREEWLRERAAKRERDRESEGGPNYYIVRRHRVGPALLNFVRQTMNEGVLTPTKASKVLGVKPRNVEPLLNDTPVARAR